MDISNSGNLLVVDDESDNLTLLYEILLKWGFEVGFSTSAKEALEAIKERDFDILLADLLMPEMDGIELLKEARKIDPTLVGIIITGHGTIQTAVEAMKAGAFDFVLKPFDFEALKLTLYRASEVRRLLKSEEAYRSVVEDYQTELICRLLSDGRLTFVNEAFCRYFNKTKEELIGYNLFRFVIEDDRDKVNNLFLNLNQENPIASLECRVFNQKGEISWQRWTYRAIFDKNCRLIEIQAIGRDITERKWIEKALKESENLYRTIFESTGTAIIIDEEDSTISLVNKEYEEITGYSKEETEGKKSWTEFIAKEDLDRIKSYHHQRRIEPDVAPVQYEFRLIDKNGNVKHILATVSMIPGTKKSVASLLDITNRKLAEDALNKSEEELKKKVNELEEFYNIAVNRELRMIELKEEIQILKEELEKHKKI